MNFTSNLITTTHIKSEIPANIITSAPFFNTTTAREVDPIDPVRKFECPDCGEVIRGKSHFIQHKLSHAGLKVFCCPECGRMFTRQHLLLRHTQVHTGIKKYECEKHRCGECGKSFADTEGLTHHMQGHAIAKKYYCEECGLRCDDSEDLTRHRATSHPLTRKPKLDGTTHIKEEPKEPVIKEYKRGIYYSMRVCITA
ncbi:zinc finger protein 80-like [Eriocheir sinensis]|uniref:zinc finger protein 80-like n=1 Tax=Eriocheir sinensis TaxID=95602 RepID=UPI0021C85969|nr:zinc finger protein 80-like [Eriocheir sinensis]